MDGKKQLNEKESTQRSIVEALAKHDKESHLKGEILPEEQRMFRVRVIESFLRAGICLRKVKFFHPIFKEGAYCLTDRR